MPRCEEFIDEENIFKTHAPPEIMKFHNFCFYFAFNSQISKSERETETESWLSTRFKIAHIVCTNKVARTNGAEKKVAKLNDGKSKFNYAGSTAVCV